jgi:hypothetical protein
LSFDISDFSSVLPCRQRESAVLLFLVLTNYSGLPR